MQFPFLFVPVREARLCSRARRRLLVLLLGVSVPRSWMYELSISAREPPVWLQPRGSSVKPTVLGLGERVSAREGLPPGTERSASAMADRRLDARCCLFRNAGQWCRRFNQHKALGLLTDARRQPRRVLWTCMP